MFTLSVDRLATLTLREERGREGGGGLTFPPVGRGEERLVIFIIQSRDVHLRWLMGCSLLFTSSCPGNIRNVRKKNETNKKSSQRDRDSVYSVYGVVWSVLYRSD